MSLPDRSAHGDTGWLESLRDELDRRFQAERDMLDERDRRYTELRAADAKSVDLAKTEVDRRLADMNELRLQIERERGEFLRRDEYDIRHEALSSKIALEHDQIALLKTEIAVGPGDLPALRSQLDVSGGERRGRTATWSIVLAIALGLASWLSLLITLLTHLYH